MAKKDEAETDKSKLERFSHIVDITLKILAALVIPLILWGIRLEVNNAVLRTQMEGKEKIQNERLISTEKQLKTEIGFCQERTKERQSDIAKVQTIVQDNSKQLGKLTTGIKAANQRLDDILKYFSKSSK